MVATSTTATATLDPDGQLRVPRQISEATGIRAGGKVLLSVVGPGRFEVLAAEAVAAGEPAEHRVEGEIEPMTLEEAFTRFVTDEPVDVRKIRQEWEEDAAREVLAEMERNALRTD